MIHVSMTSGCSSGPSHLCAIASIASLFIIKSSRPEYAFLTSQGQDIFFLDFLGPECILLKSIHLLQNIKWAHSLGSFSGLK